MIIEKKELPQIPRVNNFDFLRFMLATVVAICHYYRLTGRGSASIPMTAPTAVSAFFAISGFLIFMSFCNTSNFKEYLFKRISRIFPAYICIVLLSYLLFSVVSSLCVADYFTSAESLKYLIYNLLFCNFWQPTLPGVLSDAPFTDAINPSLWTLKIELTLYLCVPIIAICALKKRIVLPLLTVFLSVLCYYINWKADVTGIAVYEKIGSIIYQCNMFLIGACFYLYFNLFYKYRYYVLIFSLLLYPLKESGWPDLLFPFALAGCVFGIAFSFPFLNKFGKIGDISYGTYLYHGPVIQFFTALGWNEENRLFLVLGLTYALAFVSWHLMEKRFLRRG